MGAAGRTSTTETRLRRRAQDRDGERGQSSPHGRLQEGPGPASSAFSSRSSAASARSSISRRADAVAKSRSAAVLFRASSSVARRLERARSSSDSGRFLFSERPRVASSCCDSTDLLSQPLAIELHPHSQVTTGNPHLKTPGSTTEHARPARSCGGWVFRPGVTRPAPAGLSQSPDDDRAETTGALATPTSRRSRDPRTGSLPSMPPPAR